MLLISGWLSHDIVHMCVCKKQVSNLSVHNCLHKKYSTFAYMQVSESSHTLQILSHRGHIITFDWHTSCLRTHTQAHTKVDFASGPLFYIRQQVVTQYHNCLSNNKDVFENHTLKFINIRLLTWEDLCCRKPGHTGILWDQLQKQESREMCTSPATGNKEPPSRQGSFWQHIQ